VGIAFDIERPEKTGRRDTKIRLWPPTRPAGFSGTALRARTKSEGDDPARRGNITTGHTIKMA